MVAKITVPGSIKRALNYNEQKVKDGLAKCIHAHNFLKDASALNFYDKLLRFEKLITLNKRASTNTVHISLNFAAHEKINREQLVRIAGVYMQKIGFEHQPYLIYEHYDAGHPHLHIVTTNIQQNGSRISLHNLGKNGSNQARKEIEISFGLVKAEEQKKKPDENLSPVDVQKIIYGKSPTKKAITKVLKVVIPDYKYASIAELNAVLKMYNIIADAGEAGSKIAEHHGLVYRVLDGNGNKVGVPVKASSIQGNPTLSCLQKKFAENERLKPSFKKSTRSSIDWVLRSQHTNIFSFQKALEKEKITLVIRQNDEGLIYGLTYVDHRSKTVFNGSDLGKGYSAKAILEKCSPSAPGTRQLSTQVNNDTESNAITLNKYSETLDIKATEIFESLSAPLEQNEQLPYPFRLRRKKKRKQQ